MNPSQAFDIAKVGSNQASLEQPKNGVEYALSTADKMVNWARQGSMWPMVSLYPLSSLSTAPLLHYSIPLKPKLDHR